MHMLRGGDPVVGDDVGDFSALGIDPYLAGTDVNGVGHAVIRNIAAFGKMRLHFALCVVGEKKIVGGADDPGIV